MESIDTFLIVLLSVAIVIVAAACVVILSRGRKAQSTADEARRKPAEEELRRDAEQEAVRRAEEEERQRAEAERRRLEEDLRRAEEERPKAEEQRKHLEQEKHRRAEKEHKHFEEKQRRRVEEEHKRLDEEAQQKAEAQRQIEELQQADEEERHSEADEAQQEEEQRQVADEEGRRAEKVRKRIGEEKGHKAEEVQPEVETEIKQLEPVKRGGRPRGFSQERERQPAQETTSRCPKPEIICWKKERQWMAAVEIPEEFLEKSGLAVLQDGSPLTREESREACWPLERVFGEVVVNWNEGEAAQETRVVLGQDGYLLFKLSGQDQNQGRHVKSPSSGSYLVMAPDPWERDDTLSGPPPVTPEPVFLHGYQAHFFELEKDGGRKIAFLTSTGKSFVIESKTPQFELVGNRLCDATEKIGPLFGERPPQIRAPDDQTWKHVRTIVVGEEGSGKGRWRATFSPMPGRTEQVLPSGFEERKGGWYFLRFYDTRDDLIESLDFRFLCALKEIKVLQPSPLPSEDGHRPVSVKFLHEPGCDVQPDDGLTRIQIERQPDTTILTVPPDPTYDKTRWLVGHQGGTQIGVTILVERLWWAVSDEDKEPAQWGDRPLTLIRDDFAAMSTKALWLQLPRRRWVDKVLVGFEQPKARPYNVKVTEKTVVVPLRDFCDSEEVADETQEYPLKVWIQRDNGTGKGLLEGVVANVPAKRPEEQRKAESQKAGIEAKIPMHLHTISAPRLTTVLTRLHKHTVGSFRLLLKEVRRLYVRGRSADEIKSTEFTIYALCIIALYLELHPQTHVVKKRWAVRARLAGDKFPEIMNHLRNRYQQITQRRR